MSDQPKHTPGPWRVHHWTNRYVVIGCEENVAKLEDYAHAEEDAKLIARAPELLAENERLRALNAELVEACERVVGRYDGRTTDDSFIGQPRKDPPDVAQCRAVLAKAKGA